MPPMRLFIVALMGLLIVAVLVILLRYFFWNKKIELYTVDYSKELNLFKGMSVSEQQKYLSLSKSDKIAQYGHLLTQ